MTSPVSENAKTVIRPIQYRDLEAIEQLATEASDADSNSCSDDFVQKLHQVRRWYGLLKFLSWFPNPYKYAFCVYVAEAVQNVRGLIKISPFNGTRSTWRVDRVLVDADASIVEKTSPTAEIGSALLRHCFETIWEARTWLLEVNIHNKATLALYRQNGFQPLAQLTYWTIAPDLLKKLADHEPDLPNLLPVSNADAQLLYHLDTMSMPPLVRQVFDRHTQDFKTGFVKAFLSHVQQWFSRTESVSAYVFEPQRKAAIGYFQLKVCRDGSKAHTGQMTVHPAYTFLYPELLSQMARVVQDLPEQSLELESADYQPEREEFLEQLGAEQIEHTLLMSRSVWHKLREAKPVSLEGLHLSEVLQGLQRGRTPVPTRIMWWQSLSNKHKATPTTESSPASSPSRAMRKETTPPAKSPDTRN
jgi:ribosomal protein S18 acetylase RimI-like enzyme